MKKSVRLYITGTVQGMFYRQLIKQNAERYDVKGFIRTLDDGRIEVFLEGNMDDVKKVSEVCRTGPKHTRITNVEEKDEKFQDLKGFKILHI